MLKLARYIVLFLITLIGLVWVNPTQAANEALSVAHHFDIKLPDGVSTIPDGSIVSHQDDQYILSPEPYDKSIFGVVAYNAALEIIDNNHTPAGSDYTSLPIVVTGTTLVRVNNQNGEIKVGDNLTSSSIPGVAMKANKTGFILGVAQNDWTPNSAQEEGLISITLDPRFAFGADSPNSERIGTQLLAVVNLSSIAALENPTTTLKYVCASLLVIGSIIFAFLTFGRIARDSIQAFGRNPLASRAITLGLFLNILIALTIIAVGIGAAWFLLNFKG